MYIMLKCKSINLKLAYNPKSVAIGMASLFFIAGVTAAFQALPSLAQSRGTNNALYNIH